jgi:two-component system, OmpR family, sensor histidine kinase ChvG
MTSLTESPRIPDLVTGGLSTTAPSKPKREVLAAVRPSFWRSTGAKVALLLIVFVSFPAIVYQQLQSVDALWQAPELRLVMLAYAGVAAVVFSIVFGLVANLRRLAAAARSVRIAAPATTAFSDLNRVPELAGIAEEFDRMVGSLRQVAEEGRSAADETAHAFKTPIATIAHALMPLRGAVPPENARARRSVELIEQTAARLDALVTTSRKMEQARCRIIHPPRWRLDLGTFMRDAVASKLAVLDETSVRLTVDSDSGVYVYGNDDILETIVDNIIDNAVAVSPADGSVAVTVRQRDGEAVCYFEDEGPGLPPEAVERVFERYASYQPASNGGIGADEDADGEPARYGIGLWIVRRNVEALGGKVWAENRSLGGLRIVITLPRV